MPKRDDDAELDLTLAGAWRRDDDAPLERWTLRSGSARYELVADRATAEALVGFLRAVPAALRRLEEARDRLAGEVDALAAERDALVRRAERAAASAEEPRRAAGFTPAAAARRVGAAALADVPLAMIGTFRVDDPKVKAAARKDPLMALAVQVAKALAPDASELDQARLRAMATAASRADLDTFWAASTERSKKKLAGA